MQSVEIIMSSVLTAKMPRASCLHLTGSPGNGGMEQPIMAPPSWHFTTSSTDSATPWCSAIISTVSQSGLPSYYNLYGTNEIYIRDEILETCIRKPITNIFVQNSQGHGHHCDYSNRY